MSPSQPPSRAPPTYSSAETVSDEGAKPIPVSDGFRDPASTGNTGGSPTKDVAHLWMLYPGLERRMWRVEVVALIWFGGLVAVVVLAGGWVTWQIGQAIGWWLAGAA